MTDAVQIEQALRASLPPAQHGLAPQLAAILAAAASGMIGDDEARAQVAALPGADRAAQALISFGSAQTGDVQTGDIAGRDIVKFSLSLLAQPQRPQTQFYGDYTLPAIYVERDKLLAQVREQLLTSPQSLALTSAMKVQRPAALHGMGGIGKTVLARALCDDPAIRAAFPDGIFWVTLGQTPELVRPLRGIVELLDGMSYGDYVEQLTYLLFLNQDGRRAGAAHPGHRRGDAPSPWRDPGRPGVGHRRLPARRPRLRGHPARRPRPGPVATPARAGPARLGDRR